MMSRAKKVLIILQLCFALSLLIWLFIKPFVIEVAAKKSQLALQEMVLEKQELFQALPRETQTQLQHTTLPPPALSTSPSPFALAWIFFALAICFLILFHIEGAAPAAWLLPLLVLPYAYFHAPPPPNAFFPEESYVKERYTHEGEHLVKGWHRYLVTEWAHETPSSESATYEAQLDRALFAFNVARLEWIQAGKGDDVITAGFTSPPTVFRIITYFLWNGLFAWGINRRTRSRSAPQSSTS